jgi:hypothetical protein
VGLGMIVIQASTLAFPEVVSHNGTVLNYPVQN